MTQASFPVSYKGQMVGGYPVDLVVEDRLVMELKCVERFGNEHMAQCINYLKASAFGFAVWPCCLALLFNLQRPRLSGNGLCMGTSAILCKRLAV